ncbi:MAG: tetratricopeptide (TPR) repeat protein [Chlamydiales bacterium]|jgi:tetratricopeptide (TPR) repeat protein
MMDLAEIKREELKDAEALEELKQFEELQDFFVNFEEEDPSGGVIDKLDALEQDDRTLEEILGIGREIMDIYYECSREILGQKLYEHSGNAFLFMTMLNPYVYDYWMGLALSEHLSGKYDVAIRAYSMAALTNMDHPAPHFFVGQCLAAQEKYHDAIGALEYTMKMTVTEEEYQSFYKKARALKKSVEAKI